MKILAIDTSTRYLCIGVYDSKKGIFEYRLDLGRRHLEFIFNSIRSILEYMDLKINDFDYFALGLGPGSFTGIRIGTSVVKGFAFAHNKPVIGISSLDIIASNALTHQFGEPYEICPIIDAKRNLVYAARYKLDSGMLKKQIPYQLISIEGFLKKTRATSIFLGDGLLLYADIIKLKAKKAKLLDSDYWYPKATNLIELAKEKIRRGKFSSHEKIRPIYLYPKECQIKTGLRIPACRQAGSSKN